MTLVKTWDGGKPVTEPGLLLNFVALLDSTLSSIWVSHSSVSPFTIAVAVAGSDEEARLAKKK